MTNLVNIKILEDYSTIEGIIILNDKKAFEHNAKDKINKYIFGGNICNSELRKECNDSSIYCFICQVKYIKCPLFLFFPYIYVFPLINIQFVNIQTKRI